MFLSSCEKFDPAAERQVACGTQTLCFALSSFAFTCEPLQLDWTARYADAKMGKWSCSPTWTRLPRGGWVWNVRLNVEHGRNGWDWDWLEGSRADDWSKAVAFCCSLRRQRFCCWRLAYEYGRNAVFPLWPTGSVDRRLHSCFTESFSRFYVCLQWTNFSLRWVELTCLFIIYFFSFGKSLDGALFPSSIGDCDHLESPITIYELRRRSPTQVGEFGCR